MQKLITLLLTGSFIFSCSPAAEKEEEVYNDLFNDHLKGNVIMVETSPYLAGQQWKSRRNGFLLY